jgi:hypothetical protein
MPPTLAAPSKRHGVNHPQYPLFCLLVKRCATMDPNQFSDSLRPLLQGHNQDGTFRLVPTCGTLGTSDIIMCEYLLT